MLITVVTLLITPLIATHEPASRSRQTTETAAHRKRVMEASHMRQSAICSVDFD